MKTRIAILCLVAVLLSGSAFALVGNGYPPAAEGAVHNAMSGILGGTGISLEFDPSYSYVQDGFLTACFYAFDNTQSNYLEFYLLIPETAAKGDILSGSSTASIMLYEVHADSSEDLYYTYLGFPQGTSMTITIGNADTSAGSYAFSGSVEAVLGADSAKAPEKMFELKDATFDFTFSPSQSKAPSDDLPKAPSPENTPEAPSDVPVSTLPPKTVKL